MKTVLILSGGMDSTVLLFDLLKRGDTLAALSFNYGQRHKRELDFAAEVCRLWNIPHRIVDLGLASELLEGSSQTSPGIPVPEGHYAEESMKRTVVPNRNMVMLSLATAYAISKRFDRVAYAAHGGDHAIYPDCRREFVEALAQAVTLADWHPVKLHAPYLDKTKADIASIGDALGVPFHLTWSCYKGGILHCGKCGTCVERIEAFKLAGVPDPTGYDPR